MATSKKPAEASRGWPAILCKSFSVVSIESGAIGPKEPVQESTRPDCRSCRRPVIPPPPYTTTLAGQMLQHRLPTTRGRLACDDFRRGPSRSPLAGSATHRCPPLVSEARGAPIARRERSIGSPGLGAANPPPIGAAGSPGTARRTLPPGSRPSRGRPPIDPWRRGGGGGVGVSSPPRGSRHPIGPALHAAVRLEFDWTTPSDREEGTRRRPSARKRAGPTPASYSSGRWPRAPRPPRAAATRSRRVS